MARITIEDCSDLNQFDLILKATKEARELEKNSNFIGDSKREKPAVAALRKIATSIKENSAKKEDDLM